MDCISARDPALDKRIRKQSAAFLGATFGVTWLLWFGASFAFMPNPTPLIMFGTAVPSAMGLIFSAAFGGKAEFKRLLRSTLQCKAPRIWWFYTVLLFPSVLLCACVVFVVMGGALPPAQFPIWSLPVAFFYIFICMGPLGEEMGWRGFLLRHFLPIWGVIRSGLILGLIWSAWHIPLFLIPGTIQHELAKMGIFIAAFGYFLYTTCISLLISLLYARTEGNLLLCMIFHTICNLSLGAAPIILIKTGAAVLLVTLIFITVFILTVAAGKHRKPSAPKGAPYGE